MKRKVIFRFMLGLTLLVTASLACGLISNVRERAQDLQATAQFVGTEVGSGLELLETGQAFATQIDGSEMMETAQAMVTQVDESGLFETAQAFITEQGPGMGETAWALATQLVSSVGEAPEDVPVMEGEKTNFFASKQAISYIIDVDFKTALDYYEREMPANGWTRVETGTVVTDNTAVIFFEKDGRQTIVTLSVNPMGAETIVLITMQGE